jgi:hypothetical protein
VALTEHHTDLNRNQGRWSWRRRACDPKHPGCLPSGNRVEYPTRVMYLSPADNSADLSGAVRVTSAGWSCPLTSGSQDLAQAVYPVRRHTEPALPHDHHASTPLTAPGAAATAARGTGAFRVASTHDRSTRRPPPVSVAATAWPTCCHSSVRTVAMAAVNWREARLKPRQWQRAQHRPFRLCRCPSAR